ncbi:hypothetical protein [Ciceribacter sp. L1K22]|uniref:hypothetical protein n=1 Tax=Ciceribacter sp. L1K22 TaxID=2820275 RepID=UPI001ABE5792|nr:hypothetical protein [Ciceribacter sp. L1K22]MBO3760630.1 hypothetical protein [Ciceribacter sp. L1K22]
MILRSLMIAAWASAAMLTQLPLKAQAGEIHCHANENFNVAVREYDEEPGSQFAVTVLDGAEAPADCVFDAQLADIVIGEAGDPLWYGELTADFLVTTRSTGPEGDLVVFDLSTGEKVLDAPADEYDIEDGFISFWQRAGEATSATCTEYAENQANGFGSVILEHVAFDLQAKTLEKTGDTRCGATQ